MKQDSTHTATEGQSETQEEMWNEVEQILRYREDESHPISNFILTRKKP